MKSKIKIAICIFSITVILACLIQAIPKFSYLQKYKAGEYSKSSTDSEVLPIETSTLTESYDSSGDSTEANTNEEYQTTQDYKDKEKQINAVRERIDLIQNGIISDLTDTIKNVFNQITIISANPDNIELRNKCRQYMTDEYYERFKSTSFNSGSYMAYDIKFSDLDKESITAYVQTRSTERFILSFSFDHEKNHVINNIFKITE